MLRNSAGVYFEPGIAQHSLDSQIPLSVVKSWHTAALHLCPQQGAVQPFLNPRDSKPNTDEAIRLVRSIFGARYRRGNKELGDLSSSKTFGGRIPGAVKPLKGAAQDRTRRARIL